MNIYSIGGQIKGARLSANLTQEELARKLGVTSTYISHLEHGRAEPSVSLLRGVAKWTKTKMVIRLEG